MGKKAEQHYQAALNIDLKHEHVHQYLSNLCTAAKLRHPSAIYTLSLFFQFGDMGLRQNLDLAERLRQISFKLNHPHAIDTYALDAFFKNKDSKLGLELLNRAQKCGSQAALWHMSYLHASGKFGCKHSRSLATFYKRQAENGKFTII